MRCSSISREETIDCDRDQAQNGGAGKPLRQGVTMYTAQISSAKKPSGGTRLSQKRSTRALTLALIVGLALTAVGASSGALAQTEKPNIVLIVSDDFGYGDAGVYGGGPGRGMPTPN